MSHLVSERVGEFRLGEDRLEFTEFGSGERWVVLLHGQLMPRRMHDPLARVLAADGFHVVTLDLLGHGRSDRPTDPKEYSMTSWGEQVVALLDHLGVDRAVVGGTSLGANVSLEVAAAAPERVQGLLVEMPVLDNAVENGILAFAPLLLLAGHVPLAVRLTSALAGAVPRHWLGFWPGIVAETLQQRPEPMAAVIQGIFFGRVAPSSRLRRTLDIPALVVGHPRDPIHLAVDARMLAEELPRATYVEASGILEWRYRPERLNGIATDFLDEVWGRAGADAAPGAARAAGAGPGAGTR